MHAYSVTRCECCYHGVVMERSTSASAAAAGAGRGRSFTRAASSLSSSGHLAAVGVKPGPHGTSLVSSGIAHLDDILGGGLPVGVILMIMEDLEAPHHMLLLRYFMAQGVVHGQQIFFASPLPSPKAFLGTLPGPGKEASGGGIKEAADHRASSQEENLRIAWQYRRYLEQQKALEDRRQRQASSANAWSKLQDTPQATGTSHEFCSTFDMRRPVDRVMLSSAKAECHSLQRGADLLALRDQCAAFIAKLSRPSSQVQEVGRIAMQSLSAPDCMQSCTDWELLAFLADLKSMVRSSNAVAVISFPAALLKPSILKRWQHLSDILISVEACPDDNKELASLLTGYQDIAGFLRIHRLATINTQVPHTPEAAMYAIKVPRRKTIELERLQQAPFDATLGGSSSGSVASLLCGGPPNATSSLEF